MVQARDHDVGLGLGVGDVMVILWYGMVWYGMVLLLELEVGMLYSSSISLDTTNTNTTRSESPMRYGLKGFRFERHSGGVEYTLYGVYIRVVV